jgi:hypothetical protein
MKSGWGQQNKTDRMTVGREMMGEDKGKELEQ